MVVADFLSHLTEQGAGGGGMWYEGGHDLVSAGETRGVERQISETDTAVGDELVQERIY